jgi:hypothetical protein
MHRKLKTFRHNIQRNPSRLKNIIASKEFVKYFGEAKQHPKGERQNIYGREDALKVAPKGIDKNHPEIELLKQRSLVVSCRYVLCYYLILTGRILVAQYT